MAATFRQAPDTISDWVSEEAELARTLRLTPHVVHVPRSVGTPSIADIVQEDVDGNASVFGYPVRVDDVINSAISGSIQGEDGTSGSQGEDGTTDIEGEDGTSGIQDEDSMAGVVSDGNYNDNGSQSVDTEIVARFHVLAQKWTVPEFWAALMAVKIKCNLPDSTVQILAKLINAASIPISARMSTTSHGYNCEIERAVPFKPTYVVFCADCDMVLHSSTTRVKTYVCTECNRDLTSDLKVGGSYFVVFSIREQLLGYLRDKRLLTMMRDFAPLLDTMLGGHEPYTGILRGGNLSFTVCCNAVKLTRGLGVNLFPTLFILQQIPLAAQSWYPILGAIYCGKKPLPSFRVLLEHNLKELREMARTKPLQWVDHSLGNIRRCSSVFLTLCSTNAPQKAVICDHMRFNQKFSCPYCEMEGIPVTFESFPEAFDGTNVFARAPSPNVTKFPDLLHNTRVRLREDSDRVVIGREVLLEKIAAINRTGSEVEQMHRQGIKGIPVIHSLDHFQDVWSHTSGILHIVCEGIAKDMLGFSTNSVGQDHSFRQRATDDGWNHFLNIQKSVCRISEMDHNTNPISDTVNWKASDYYNFLLCEVALVCCDEEAFMDKELYAVWSHLASAVYLLLHGRPNERILVAAEREIQEFAERFRAKFGPTHCTWKFHVLQHFPALVRKHGSACLWDDLIYKRVLGCLVSDVASTRLHVNQAARNFMLRHQAEYFQGSDEYDESCRAFIEELGVPARSSAFTKLLVEPLTLATPEWNSFGADVLARFQRTALSSLEIDPSTFQAAAKERVTRLRRMHQTISSAAYRPEEDSVVDDSYIQIHDQSLYFGQVSEILWLPEFKTAFLMLQLFEKVVVTGSTGLEIDFPINQFPVRQTAVTKVFRVTRKLFIQKIVRGKLTLKGNPLQSGLLFFAVRPNEWFHI